MDYKKKYEEALERAKASLKDGGISQNSIDYIQSIFPELKESEDERIRKAIIDFFSEPGRKEYILKGFTVNDILAWLEKQGKTQGKTALEEINEEKADNANKVKLKFKPGDWIVSKTSNLVYHVDSILFPQSKCYYLSHNGGIVLVNFTDEQNYRLWTIQDAKEGDVLEFEDHGRHVTGIVSFVNKKTGKVDVSCLLENDKFKKGIFFALDTIDPHPADKKQRDLLFQKMHEEGYDWDSEKKKLKKIKHDVQLTEFEEAVKDLMNDYRDAIGDNDATIEAVKEHAAYMLSLVHQNHAWNEEDEKMVNDDIIAAIDTLYYHGMVNWLKSLKNRVQTQPKQEWNEEDEERIKNIISVLDVQVYWDGATGKKGNPYQKEIDWLKSLRPQSQWKPSDEQMKYLLDATFKYNEFSGEHAGLVELYKQLKKLIE